MKKLISAIGCACLLYMAAVSPALGDVDKIEDMSHKGGKLGGYHALIIGVDVYKDPKIPEIKSAAKAASELSAVLRQYYGFSTEVLINRNATKDAIMKSVKRVGMNRNGTEIIFFAGRGLTDSSGGYWLPSDAKAGDTESYIKNETIQSAVRDMKARSVLLISDAAYSDTYFGSLHKLPATISDAYYLNLYNKQSRWGLSSGNDSSKESGISKFSSEIIAALKENEKPQYSLQELYEKIKGSVKGGNRPVRCRSLRNSGDQGGEPVFVLTQAILDKIELAKGGDPKNLKSNLTDKEKLQEGALLSLALNVPTAEVVLDGTRLGKGPLNKIFLVPGAHQVEVIKDGYEPYKKAFVAKKGIELNFNTELKKIEIKPTKGALTVTVVPATAEVKFLDSTLTYSPGIALEAGNYKLEFASPFCEKQVKEVVVKANETSAITVTLEPMKVINHKNLGNFILINPGSFEMGSPDKEPARSPNEKQHKVTLTHRFYMQEKEMTVEQWGWFVKTAGYKTESESGEGISVLADYVWTKDTEYSWRVPGFKQGDKNPVVGVTWNDTQAFIKWLNKQNKGVGYTFRLPLESEWEYACRAATKDRFNVGPCIGRDKANYDASGKYDQCPVGVASTSTMEVGHFAPNPWGLYDMHGNVMEWCQDWLGDYPAGEVTDPTGPQAGTEKVVRGGGWASYPYNIRCAKRFGRNPNEGFSDMGFRLVIVP